MKKRILGFVLIFMLLFSFSVSADSGGPPNGCGDDPCGYGFGRSGGGPPYGCGDDPMSGGRSNVFACDDDPPDGGGDPMRAIIDVAIELASEEDDRREELR